MTTRIGKRVLVAAADRPLTGGSPAYEPGLSEPCRAAWDAAARTPGRITPWCGAEGNVRPVSPSYPGTQSGGTTS